MSEEKELEAGQFRMVEERSGGIEREEKGGY